jgi:hypothetical protein
LPSNAAMSRGDIPSLSDWLGLAPLSIGKSRPDIQMYTNCISKVQYINTSYNLPTTSKYQQVRQKKGHRP